jgi:hypothetical protein
MCTASLQLAGDGNFLMLQCKVIERPDTLIYKRGNERRELCPDLNKNLPQFPSIADSSHLNLSMICHKLLGTNKGFQS